MAKILKLPKGREFQFRSSRAGQPSRYDWDNWLNGELLILEQSVGSKNEVGDVVEVTEKRDYEVRTDMMPHKLRAAARRRYKIVQISRLDADGKPLEDALIIRARDMDEEERKSEDLRRAEEKARRAEESGSNASAGTAAEDSE